MNVKYLKSAVVVALCLASSSLLAEQQVSVWNGGQTQAAPQSNGQMPQKWVNSATLQLRGLMNNSAQNIATSIQGITHPSGNSAYLIGYNVLNLGDHMMVQINVGWKGGFIGNAYQTSVNWEVSPDGNMGAKVVGDTAQVAIEPENHKALDDYFSQSVFPVFYSNMQNVSFAWKEN
jgi:hypothetical protein